jgi:protein-S-isoprenylcysteine O-methyltransferase Ste14
MSGSPSDPRFVAVTGVALCWIAFAVVFAIRKRHSRGSEAKRDRLTVLGIALQGVGMAFVWGRPRTGEPIVPQGSFGLEIAVAVLALAVAAASVAFTAAAVRRLGKQWSLVARVLDEHSLVTDGPYGVVRHPIYTGIFGMLVATGLAMAPAWRIAVAVVVFGIGTWIRVQREERLLRGAFGESFEAYRRSVPAVLPIPRRRG